MNDVANPAERLKILLVHRSLGGQFEFLGKWMARNGWDVTFIFCADNFDDGGDDGVRVVPYQMRPPVITEGDFRYPLEYAAVNALGATEVFYRMWTTEGYVPDVVMAHVGWGVGLCVKQVWPGACYIAYHEWYYSDVDWSNGGKREVPSSLGSIVSDRMRNLPIIAEFDSADENWCPTMFQAGRFPPILREKIRVVSDGVNCVEACPDPTAVMDFDWLQLPAETRIVTYATRGMEPLRGFPQFMRGLQKLQQRRNDFHAVILANEMVAYGGKLAADDSWRLRMLDELDLDQRRLHVFGMRSRKEYMRVLQASSAHCYFSEPFVTSWSLSDALAAGCMVVGSNTPPVRELIQDMENGILVDMDDPDEVADMVEWAFDNPVEAARLRARARADMVRLHDNAHVFPFKERLLRDLVNARRTA